MIAHHKAHNRTIDAAAPTPEMDDCENDRKGAHHTHVQGSAFSKAVLQWMKRRRPRHCFSPRWFVRNFWTAVYRRHWTAAAPAVPAKAVRRQAGGLPGQKSGGSNI